MGEYDKKDEKDKKKQLANKLSGKKAKPAADDGGIIKKRSTAR